MRILSFLPLSLLLACAPVSMRPYAEEYKFPLRKFEQSFVLLPSAAFSYGRDEADFSKGSTNGYMLSNSYDTLSRIPSRKTLQVDSYYISKKEVTNWEYQEFLGDLKSQDPAMYQQMLPDTTIFDTAPYSYGQPMLNTYHRHPAYGNCPVVGISYEQATQYCKWLTKRYTKEQKRKFKKVVFKLPSLAQWTLAAMADKAFSTFPKVAWAMQDDKGAWKANFRVVQQYDIGKDIDSAKGGGATVLNVNRGVHIEPVGSYEPSAIGLYDMAGNVEEFVSEKGISKGGSWDDTGYYLQTFVEELYDTTNSASYERGFRIVMELVP